MDSRVYILTRARVHTHNYTTFPPSNYVYINYEGYSNITWKSKTDKNVLLYARDT